MTHEELNDLKSKKDLVEKNKDRMLNADSLLSHIAAVQRGINQMTGVESFTTVRCVLRPTTGGAVSFDPTADEWKAFSVMVLNRRLAELNKEFAAL